jgi:hypothetical protein
MDRDGSSSGNPRVPNAAYNAFAEGKKLHNAELDEIRKNPATLKAPGKLGSALGARFAQIGKKKGDGPINEPGTARVPNAAYNAFAEGKKLHNAELDEIKKTKLTVPGNLGSALGARFAQIEKKKSDVPSSEPSISRMPNAAFIHSNAFADGKKLHANELDQINRTPLNVPGSLGSALGARAAKMKAPEGAPSIFSGGGWRERAAAEKARADNARALFQNKSPASLPPGDIDCPRWNTAFQIDSPDEGTTGGLVFIATLAGSFAVKSGSDLFEEYLAARFLEQLGVPVPQMRVIHPTDTEYKVLVQSVQKVAVEYAFRGDLERRPEPGKLTKFSGPLLLMQCVAGAHTLGQLGHVAVQSMLELGSQGTDERVRAEHRLQAFGKCWIGDTLLRFRDRFCSRANMAEYDTFRGQKRVTSPEEDLIFLTGNMGNVLLTAQFPYFAAIDSHVKFIRTEGGRPSKDATYQQLAKTELTALMQEDPGGTITAESATEWLRFTVEVASKYRLSDEAMGAVRTGALHAIRALPAALEWIQHELSGVEDREDIGASWKGEMLRIDGEAWVEHCQKVIQFCFADIPGSEAILGALPPPPMPKEHAARIPVVAEEMQQEAQKLDASPVLWESLGDNLRQALLAERGEGGAQFNPHSLREGQKRDDGTYLLSSGQIVDDRILHCCGDYFDTGFNIDGTLFALGAVEYY